VVALYGRRRRDTTSGASRHLLLKEKALGCVPPHPPPSEAPSRSLLHLPPAAQRPHTQGGRLWVVALYGRGRCSPSSDTAYAVPPSPLGEGFGWLHCTEEGGETPHPALRATFSSRRRLWAVLPLIRHGLRRGTFAVAAASATGRRAAVPGCPPTMHPVLQAVVSTRPCDFWRLSSAACS